MTDQKTSAEKLAALREVLERIGSNTARWPEHLRDDLSKFVATDDAARQAMAEARALDDVLRLAPEPDADRMSDVAARIIETVDEDLDAHTARDFRAASDTAMPIDTVIPMRHKPSLSSENWQTAAVLAASLVVGVFAGNAGLFDTMLSGFQPTIVASTTSSPVLLTVLVEDDADVLADEELL